MKWFHKIPGVSDGGVDIAARMEVMKIPDVANMRVLDVGTLDGGYAFECERRGAAEIVAVDLRHCPTFDFAHRQLGSKVVFRLADICDLPRFGPFDLVLCLGVLYHLEDPLRALRCLRRVCGGLLVLETHVDMLGLARPAASFYPQAEAAGDYSNWWGPNQACVEGLVKAAGFGQVRMIGFEPPVYSIVGAATGDYGRMTFHAR